MDAALRLRRIIMENNIEELGFNPCFSGCRPATLIGVCYCLVTKYSFNPCFSGCRPATRRMGDIYRLRKGVSILVLVDAALRLKYEIIDRVSRFVFQSLF